MTTRSYLKYEMVRVRQVSGSGGFPARCARAWNGRPRCVMEMAIKQNRSGSSSVKKLVIWGSAGHALVATDIAVTTGDYQIAGYIDDVNTSLHGRPFGAARILGDRNQLGRL